MKWYVYISKEGSITVVCDHWKSIKRLVYSVFYKFFWLMKKLIERMLLLENPDTTTATATLYRSRATFIIFKISDYLVLMKQLSWKLIGVLGSTVLWYTEPLLLFCQSNLTKFRAKAPISMTVTTEAPTKRPNQPPISAISSQADFRCRMSFIVRKFVSEPKKTLLRSFNSDDNSDGNDDEFQPNSASMRRASNVAEE